MTPTVDQPVVKKIPPVPPWLQRGQIVLKDPGYIHEIAGAKGQTVFKSNPGPQTWAMFCQADEMLVGGRRGGGKSVCLTAWMANGDLTLPANDPARLTFLGDRAFRGLFLREEYQSLVEFIEEAVAFYKPLGGKPTGGNSKPVVLEFPDSGAKIYFNHLKDESAYEKYKGWNLTRIGIEELTLVPTLRRYLKLQGSLRSTERVRNGKTLPALRTQMMSTTNPDGPGAEWIKARFVEVRDGKGHLIPWNTPMRDKVTGNVRIFIPFGIEDNPHLSPDTPHGKRYMSNLLAQDEVTRKQWIEGDWNAGTGKFFKEYRPDGPIGAEEVDKYPWANHIIQSVPLKPWWMRWGSGDTGFDHPSVFHKFCRNDQDKRVHIYDELKLRNVGYFEQGAILARWWHPELLAMQRSGKDPSVTIHLGADAFTKTDVTKTKAEQIAAGIQEVLGPYGALLLKYDETEREMMKRDPKFAQRLFENRKRELSGHIHIVLKPVYLERISAWGYFRDMLRFRPAVLPLQTAEDREKYLREVAETEGVLAYEMQAAELRNLKPEILPKLQIWKICVELDRCLRAAQHDNRADGDPARVSKREDVLKFNADENGENGDDALEGARNGILAFKEAEVLMPRSDFVNERMATAQQTHEENFGESITDVNRLLQIQRMQSALYDKQNKGVGGTLTLPRQGSLRHRAN